MTMNDDNKKINITIGSGFTFSIFVFLLVMKLAGILNISWWLVTLPLWFGLGVVIAIILFVAIIYILCLCIGGIASILKLFIK